MKDEEEKKPKTTEDEPNKMEEDAKGHTYPDTDDLDSKDKGEKDTDLKNKPKTSKGSDLKGYPLYPDSEDVYAQDKEEKDIDPEDVTKKKPKPDTDSGDGGKAYVEDETGEDLDVPGNEDDEKEDNAGIEDEENNYYSLGGDDHEDLEEDKGEYFA